MRNRVKFKVFTLYEFGHKLHATKVAEKCVFVIHKTLASEVCSLTLGTYYS
jgi:hypothetical protein